MARMIIRRSSSFLATKGWIAPEPRSKPSRRTYMAIINATATNQNVSIFLLLPVLRRAARRSALGQLRLLRLCLRTVGYLAHHQQDVQEAHDQVHPGEPNKGEEHVPGGDVG